MEINRELLRWVILIGAAPIWIPFLFTLWRDFNDALREDGGLLGNPPSPRELEKIQAERGSKPDLLVNEPIIRPDEHRQPRMSAPAQRAPAPVRSPRGFRGGSAR